MSAKLATLWVVSLGLAALVSASCTKSTPTSPGAVTTVPASSGNVNVTINPNPVPFSGVPVTDDSGCATLPNTWYYDQLLQNTGGTDVTLSGKIDQFDGFVVNNLTNMNIVVPANGSTVWHSRWCSGNPTAHTAESTWTGLDAKGQAVTAAGPIVNLLKK